MSLDYLDDQYFQCTPRLDPNQSIIRVRRGDLRVSGPRAAADVKQGVARLRGLRPLGAGHVALGRGPEAAEARRPPRVQLVPQL